MITYIVLGIIAIGIVVVLIVAVMSRIGDPHDDTESEGV